MILAFLLPFLIIGGLTIWHWYDYGLKDIHTGRARFVGWEVQQPGDDWEALKLALILGLGSGVAAGTLGLGIYGLTRYAKRKT